MRFAIQPIALLAVLISCTYAVGDEVVFRDGNRLSGKIETYAGDKLTITTKSAGKVSADMKDVSTFSSDGPIDVVLNDGKVIHEQVSAGAAGQVVLGAAGAAQAVALTQIKAVNPPPVKWSGSFVVGGLLSRGNTNSDSFNASFDATRRTERDRITVGVNYIFTRERVPGDGKHETADDLLGKAKYDYFFTKKLYGYANIEAEHDVIAGLELRLAPGVGLGYQWIETPGLSFNTEAGAGVLYRKYSHDGDMTSPNARIAYHLKGKVNEQVSYFHNFEYLPGLDRINNYYFDTDAGVRAAFTEQMFSEFKTEYRYDSQQAKGRQHSDLRFLLGVGWKF